jgi:DNA-binding LacI/PurR family transcriptional regulator
MDVLERRIASGEYMLKDLPGERTIADEVGVSYMTARKAVLQLIERGVLTRRPNGSLVVHPKVEKTLASARVALLIPAYPSVHLMRCRLELSKAMDERGIQHRTVEYLHWDDSAVSQALDGADGLVVIPMTEPMPARTLRAFTAESAKVVIFDGDMTEHGLPSVRLFAQEHIGTLFEHLWALGHRRIDCLSTQGHNDEIGRRIDNWRSWLSARGGTGELWEDPVAAHADPVASAHRLMHEVLRDRPADLQAMVCTTQPAAVGAMRACCDEGLRIGHDISICTVNNEPTGRYSCPSLTGLEMPDIAPLMQRCFDWFTDRDATWSGEQRIEPAEPILYVGESTGPARAV